MVAIAVCAGSDCAEDQRKRFRRLVAALEDIATTRTRCLGVCHGPVAVIGPQSEMPVVVQRIRARHHATIVRLAGGGQLDASDDLPVVDGKKKRAKALARSRAAG